MKWLIKKSCAFLPHQDFSGSRPPLTLCDCSPCSLPSRKSLPQKLPQTTTTLTLLSRFMHIRRHSTGKGESGSPCLVNCLLLNRQLTVRVYGLLLVVMANWYIKENSCLFQDWASLDKISPLLISKVKLISFVSTNHIIRIIVFKRGGSNVRISNISY
jgi:hypothetical protein